ncbi:ABC transporter ATP-binding protein [Sutcliffiella rhizosphaerae]|uniref:Glycine betaine/carnitine/choline transport ATP-binding protein OpuCA n=1 Tax=Sutcliffiella rhizosphaerae TaxID=2880967 RepID=A0ABN8AA13_9BACI|nr:phosphate ABC transporter ATP-binding protein [Sutcliffiella rhizosphaerae]CAG9622025.1 Glycine betaine/carnitine/choline transport ATP-binding protein OpuCA [Sutcliffiella rhizosphaerae]
MGEAIILKNIHYYTNENSHILKDISCTIIGGEIITLVGPSGAGKTTLLKLINGLVPLNSGEIIINGKHIEQYEPTELRKLVGIALQSAPMIKGDVYDNLSLPLRLQAKELEERHAKEILNVVGLDPSYLFRNIKDLSGGQKQKVSIARTLINRPGILLLDEITSSLDQVSQNEINNLIKKVNETYGTTIVWITHNLEQALSVGTYTWVMIKGELVEACKSKEITNSSNKMVQAFLKGELE